MCQVFFWDHAISNVYDISFLSFTLCRSMYLSPPLIFIIISLSLQAVKQSLMYASFLSVFLITVDKWRIIHQPMTSQDSLSMRRPMLVTAVVWTSSFVLVGATHFFFQQLDINPTINTPQPQPVVALDSSNLNFEYVFESRMSNPNTRPHIFQDVYHINFYLLLFSLSVFYVIPIGVLVALNLSLYFKLRCRKSVEVQRSTSVTDTYFMTLRRSTIDLEVCINVSHKDSTAAADPSTSKPSDSRLLNNFLTLGAYQKRHSSLPDVKPLYRYSGISGSRHQQRRHSALPSLSPGIVKGRTSSGRRVSLPEGR